MSIDIFSRRREARTRNQTVSSSSPSPSLQGSGEIARNIGPPPSRIPQPPIPPGVSSRSLPPPPPPQPIINNVPPPPNNNVRNIPAPPPRPNHGNAIVRGDSRGGRLRSRGSNSPSDIPLPPPIPAGVISTVPRPPPPPVISNPSGRSVVRAASSSNIPPPPVVINNIPPPPPMPGQQLRRSQSSSSGIPIPGVSHKELSKSKRDNLISQLQPTATPHPNDSTKTDFDINFYEGYHISQLEQLIIKRKKEIQQLESLLENKKQENNLCVICMEELRNTVCVPCGHLAYCNICVESLKKKGYNSCSVCRETISTYTRVFFV